MAKSPGGSVRVGGTVGSGGLGVRLALIGIAVGEAGGPTVKVEVMTITSGVPPPGCAFDSRLVTSASEASATQPTKANINTSDHQGKYRPLLRLSREGRGCLRALPRRSPRRGARAGSGALGSAARAYWVSA